LSFEESHNTLKFAHRAKKISHKAKLSEEDAVLLPAYKKQLTELKDKLSNAQDAEKKLNDEMVSSNTEGLSMELNPPTEGESTTVVEFSEPTDQLEDSTGIVQEEQPTKPPPERDNSQFEEMQKQLSEQEQLRTSLEAKIQQLTKLILVSSSVTPKGNRFRSTNAALDFLKRPRSRTVRAAPFGSDASKPLELSKSVDFGHTTLVPPEDNEEEQVQMVDARRVAALEKIQDSLNLKIDALTQQLEWRDKQLAKLTQEVKQKDEKIESLVALKVSEANSPDLEELRKLLKEESSKQIEALQDTLQDKEAQAELHRADNLLLAARMEELEQKLSALATAAKAVEN